MAPPKAILFDIGGVVVVSPFQAIRDYEITNKIPLGYINFAIQKGPSSTGAWQLIERGEVPLDDAWFLAFTAQLSQPAVWKEYWTRWTIRGGGHADGGAFASPDIGDQVPPVPRIDGKALFWEMMRVSRRPDPWMYPALKKLRQSGRFVVGALSNTVQFPTGILDDRGQLYDKTLVHDAEHQSDSTHVPDLFDVYVSSAHVGVRKPDPAAYELAVRELSRVAEGRGLGSIEAADVLFLDDIGVNLKFAKLGGLRTIKVNLGETRAAVDELGKEVGMDLLGERSKL